MYFKVVCLLLLAVISCARTDSPERLIDDVDSPGHEFSYTVSVQVNGKHTCGGAIISNQHILTAAHCIIDVVNNKETVVTVVSGTNYLSRGGQNHSVAAMFYHPEYKLRPPPTGINWFRDIAVIKLSEPMEFDEHQIKIDLPGSNVSMNKYALVSGWSSSQSSERHVTGLVSDRLTELNRLIISTDDCQNYYFYVRTRISQLVICTHNDVGEGMCRGSSGSPLVYNNRVIGIMSGHIGCGKGYPNIFTNVYEFLPMIENWLKM